jgi:anti-sigma factor RsiW
MTHLGADVAAFVDGQLPPERESAARRHLAECDRCRDLVAQQEHLKRRMAWSTTSSPAGPPAHLVAALAAVPAEPPDRDPDAQQRLRRSVGVVVALMGSSAAVLLLAYVLAPPPPSSGDPVRPDYDAYVVDFLQDAAVQRAPASASTATTVSSRVDDQMLTQAELDELDADGWPCQAVLAEDLARIDGRLLGDAAVALRYRDEYVQLHLMEQIGRLDEAHLAGFQQRTVADSVVWVRDGLPTVATWQADGVVYTIVTDASADRIAQVVADLPTTPARSAMDRIEEGLDRMTSWISAA